MRVIEAHNDVPAAAPEERPRLEDVQPRGSHVPAIACRIVTEQWFEENETQIRQLFRCAQMSDRELKAAREKVVALGDLVDKSKANVRTLIEWYRDAEIVRGPDEEIDYDQSLAQSFVRLLQDRRRKTAALAELVDLKKLKDALGKTPEHEQRQPHAWLMAIESLRQSGDTEEVVSDHQYIRDLQTENTSLRAANRHLEQNEHDHATTIATFVARVRELEIQLSAARRERDRFEIVAEGKERAAEAFKAEVDRLLNEINTPETTLFLGGVTREAAHQRQKWGSEKGAAKTPEDWFWLVGYLGGKACRYFAMAERFAEIAERIKADSSVTPAAQGVVAFVHDQARQAHEKGIHHLITSAAACANWHLNATGADKRMSPGRDFQTHEEPEAIAPAPGAYAEERAQAREGEVVDAEFPEVLTP